MEFFCEKSLLLDGINAASKAVSSKSTILAIEGILISSLGSNKISLVGYDLEIGIECNVEADIIKGGSAVINAKIFSDIIRKMPNGTIKITIDEKNITNIKCKSTEFDIVALSADDFPSLPTIEGGKTINIKANVLKSMIKQTLFSISQSDTKPVHTGSLFEVTKEQIKIVAVDGYRLAIRKEKWLNDYEASFVVPGKTLGEILKIIKDDDESLVTMTITRKHILFEIEEITLVSRLLEGEFLNYNNAIPTEEVYNLKINKRELLDCVERASLVINEKVKSPIKIKITREKLLLSCASTMGKVTDEIAIENKVDDEMEIGFNNKYLMDALKASEEEEVRISFKSPLSPCVITKQDGDECLFLILPVRLKG